MIRLENSYYAIGIEPDYGKIVSLVDKAGGYDLIADPRLAGNFCLLLPLPEMESNYLDGRAQPLSTCEQAPDSVTLSWNGPLKNERGEFDLDVKLWIELAGEEVRFRCEARNGTEYQLTEVWYPILGGLQGVGRAEERRSTEALAPTTNTAWAQPLFTDFGNTHGETLGVTGAEHSFCYPGTLSMPWISLHNPANRRALYFAALEETPRVKLLRLAFDPGTAEGRTGGNWPRLEEVDDFPLGVSMCWCHVPYTGPGKTFTGASMVLRAHDGDWRESAKLYRQWFDAHFPVTPPGRTWIRRETSFADLMFLLPEDNINLTFKEIQQWAAGAKARGIGHVMISGWHRGGHDRGYPYYEIDPRLGTWEELADGIRSAHELGLKVSFFVNCQPIDMTTEWYQRELHQYRLLDPYGVQFFVVNYWGMGTLSARTRFFTARPFSEMNPAHPEVRALLISQFKKLVEIGADGLHIDKFFQTPMDFNPRLSWTSPDRAHHEGILQFVEEMMAACRAVNPDFCFSYEGGWDRLMSYTDISWWGTGEDALKAAFPQRALTIAVAQPYDYNRLNAGVLGGSHLLVGPANYTRPLDYPPMRKLMDYVAEITKIRRELFELVSLGEKLETSEGIFRRAESLLSIGGAFAENPNARWSIFTEPRTSRRCIILGNLGREDLRAQDIHFNDRQAGACRLYQAFADPREVILPATVTIPAERVLFLAEV